MSQRRVVFEDRLGINYMAHGSDGNADTEVDGDDPE